VQRLLRDPQALITGGLLLLITFAGLLAPVLSQHDPNQASLEAVNVAMGSPGHPIGGDANGRDIFARLLASINTAAISAIICSSIALVLGTVGGLIGGYFDKFRNASEWAFTLIMTFPGLLVLILLTPITRGDFRFTMAMFGVLLSPSIYRIVRNLTVAVSRELYVDAAKVSGLTNFRILARHVLSVVRGPIIVAAAFMFGSAISVQSGLAFLGLGSKETPSFGAMIAEGFRNFYISPLQYLWPALALGVINGALVLFGNALRDVLEGARPKPAPIVSKAAVDAARFDGLKPSGAALVDVRDLGVAYRMSQDEQKEVVRGVSFSVEPGETLGLVGESGSGKTQTAFAILGVLPAEAIVTRGSIVLDGNQVIGAKEREMRVLRGASVAYIPQEPMSNLDPVYTVGSQLVEGMRASTSESRGAAKARALDLLRRVGIADPERTFRSYPHQISGGMAQRVLIAGAIASKPRLLIADEPTTALDVTVQAEILDLLRDLQAEFGMGLLLVTHNFGVVADICDRVAVMRQGELVEIGNVEEIFSSPQHEYTKSLLDSILDEETVRKDPPVATVAGRAS